jgi:hypothetical protein
MRFGLRTVVAFAGRAEGQRDRPSLWLCRCDCGTEQVLTATTLQKCAARNGGCGCIQRARANGANFTHGHAVHGKVSRTYRIWANMLNRCRNDSLPCWKDYGGRGVSVCARWLIFENFLADMGEAPEGRSLDRYPDQAGNYEPANCRWATRREQRINSRNVRLIEINGETLSATDWALRLGMSPPLVIARLCRGWSERKALFTPPRRPRALRPANAVSA